MDGSSSVVGSSTSERSYERTSLLRKSDEVTASHDSGEESSGNSPDGTGRQRHARPMPPDVRQRNESRSLLHLPRQPEKRGAADAMQQTASKNLDSPKPAPTCTQTAASVSTSLSAPPRGSSLPRNTVNRRNDQPPLAPDGVKQTGPTLRPNQHIGPTTPCARRSQASLHAMMREGAQAKDTSLHAIHKIKALYTLDKYEDMPDKEEIIFGKIKPIASYVMTPDENSDYFEKVFELYKVDADDTAVERMYKQFAIVEKFVRKDQIFEAGHLMAEFMFSKLTPNQRNQLRQEFPLLYWKTTLADDINWLFFDTIICSSTKDDNKQKEIMLKICDVPKRKWYFKRDRIEDEPEKLHKLDEKIRTQRQKTSDKITGKIYRDMSVDEKDNLRKICKARYDAVTTSRLPTFHLLIQQQDEKAMKLYIWNVLKYVPPEQRVRLLLARPDTAKGKETGDASFFTLAYSGNEQMLATYVAEILHTDGLTPAQKYEVLRAVRLDDGISAFHMMMCKGDWPRVASFTNQIHSYTYSRKDYFDAYTNRGRADIQYTVRKIGKFMNMNSMLSALLEAPVDDHQRFLYRRSAYTSAMEMGKTKCATKFKKLVKHDEKFFLVRDTARLNMAKMQPVMKKKLTFEEREAAHKKELETFKVDQVRVFLEVEARPPMLVKEEIAAYKNAQKKLGEKIADDLEKHPELGLLTPGQLSTLNEINIGSLQYANANMRLRHRADKETKREKEKAEAEAEKARKKSSWLPFPKWAPRPASSKAPSSGTPAAPTDGVHRIKTHRGLSYFPKGTVRGKFTPTSQIVLPTIYPTVAEVLDLHHTPGSSVLHYATPQKSGPDKLPESPLSPYQPPGKRDRKTRPAKATGESDEQPLIDASEGG